MHKQSLIGLSVLLLTACGGGGGASSPGSRAVPVPQSGSAKASLTFTLKKPSPRNIATVDSGTLSISVVVNALAPQVFNVTAGTGGCTATLPITCTETVNAPVGSDTFTITTYSASNAGGAALNAGTTVHTIANNTTNAVSLTLMPVVSTSVDGGAGSLRYALAGATAGDTITFLASALPTITLTSAIVVTTNNLTVSGPGPASLTIVGSNTGAFEVDSGTAATFSGIKFSGGTCSAGCAFVGTGAMTLTNDDFESNCATGQGGAISGGGGSAIAIANSIFNLNCANSPTATAYGGAIYSNGALNIARSTFTNNSAASASTTSSAGGGAIYADTASTVVLLDDTFTSNAVHQTGTAIANALGGAIFSAGPLTVHGGTFTSNTATDAHVQYSYGGAIDSDRPSGVLTIDGIGASSNPVFNLNSAENGGAIEARSNAAVTNALSNITFTNNSTLAPMHGIGGAIDIETRGSWNMTGLTFSNNTASALGGAIEYNAIGSMTLSNSSFTANSVTDSNSYNAGGAIDVQLGPSTPVNRVTNVTFTGNSSNGRGGAIRDNVGYADIYQNCTFTNNSAVIGGGALLDEGNTGVVISGSTFKSNSATGSLAATPSGGVGGAIYSRFSATKIDTSTIDSNTATDAGGGIFVEPYGSSPTPVTIVSSTISNNSISGVSYGGGGIYINSEAGASTVTLTNDTISGNTALNASGGGIYNATPALAAPALIVDFVTLSGNSAYANGGNIYNHSAAVITPSSVDHRVNRFRQVAQVQPDARRRPLGGLNSMTLTNSVLVNGTAMMGPDLNDSSGIIGTYDFLGTTVVGLFGGATVNASYQSAASLGPLSLNSPGSTKTLAVPAGSPLINAVPLGSCDQAKDQRGNSRPGSTACTPGAYEYP